MSRNRNFKELSVKMPELGFSAAEGIGPRSWQMKRSKLSKRSTTRWDELMTVR